MLLTAITESCSVSGMDWKAHINSLISFGWTVSQLSDRMGVSDQAVREILAGRTKAPRADAAIRLAAIPPGAPPPPAQVA